MANKEQAKKLLQAVYRYNHHKKYDQEFIDLQNKLSATLVEIYGEEKVHPSGQIMGYGSSSLSSIELELS